MPSQMKLQIIVENVSSNNSKSSLSWYLLKFVFYLADVSGITSCLAGEASHDPTILSWPENM